MPSRRAHPSRIGPSTAGSTPARTAIQASISSAVGRRVCACQPASIWSRIAPRSATYPLQQVSHLLLHASVVTPRQRLQGLHHPRRNVAQGDLRHHGPLAGAMPAPWTPQILHRRSAAVGAPRPRADVSAGDVARVPPEALAADATKSDTITLTIDPPRRPPLDPPVRHQPHRHRARDRDRRQRPRLRHRRNVGCPRRQHRRRQGRDHPCVRTLTGSTTVRARCCATVFRWKFDPPAARPAVELDGLPLGRHPDAGTPTQSASTWPTVPERRRRDRAGRGGRQPRSHGRSPDQPSIGPFRTMSHR